MENTLRNHDRENNSAIGLVKDSSLKIYTRTAVLIINK